MLTVKNIVIVILDKIVVLLFWRPKSEVGSKEEVESKNIVVNAVGT